MLPVMFKNSWFPTVFDDFLNTDFMPRANSTAPAVNVKESVNDYTMELAAPGAPGTAFEMASYSHEPLI